VGGIEVYEAFSFLSVPFEAEEKTIHEARKTGGMPPVRIATERGSGPVRDRKPGFPPRRESWGSSPRKKEGGSKDWSGPKRKTPPKKQ
ncbi:MAG: hypothetical protein WCL50_14535, partial [Spirochaetota bacterium]